MLQQIHYLDLDVNGHIDNEQYNANYPDRPNKFFFWMNWAWIPLFIRIDDCARSCSTLKSKSSHFLKKYRKQREEREYPCRDRQYFASICKTLFIQFSRLVYTDTPVDLEIKPYNIDRMCSSISKEGVYGTKTYLKTEIARRFQAPQNQSPNPMNGNI